MNEIILVGKVICLFFGIAYGFSNTIKACYGKPIGQPNVFMMSGGITGFVALQWLI